MMDNMKIYTVASYWSYGVECAMAIAETKEEALEMIRNQLDVSVRKEDLNEIPFKHGYTYIGGYEE